MAKPSGPSSSDKRPIPSETEEEEELEQWRRRLRRVAGARSIVALLSSPLRRAKSQSGGGGGDEMRDRRIAVARAVQRERGARAPPEQTRGKDGVAVWAARKVA